ncbi:hypothetical protein ALC57_16386, partial [Trachymyrmex cornetzi]
ALVMADPHVHYIDYPLSPKIKYFKRYGIEGAAKGKYPYKNIKAHYTKCHVSPAVDAAGPSTRGSLVTAGPSTRSTTSFTTARSKTVVKSAAPIATSKEARRCEPAAMRSRRRPPRRDAKPRVVSVEIVGGGSWTSVTKEKCGEGALKKLPAINEQPVSRTRRATSVPAEKSDDQTGARLPTPSSSYRKLYLITLTSPDEEGTQFQPGGVGRLSLKRNRSTRPPPTTTSSEGVVTRFRRSTSAPVEKSVMDARLLALDRSSSRATGNSTSPMVGACLRPLEAVYRGIQATTLITCTVTTTTCGSPITSTGFTGGVGRQPTPLTCLPQRSVLPTIGEERTSPCVAVITPPTGGFNTSLLIQPRPTTPEPERGPEERRQEGAVSRTLIIEGDKQWGGQWTVSVGRRAKRRLHQNDKSLSNSEFPPTAGPLRSPRIAPLCALIGAAPMNHHDESLKVKSTNINICPEKTPSRNVLPVGEERRRRETSPEDRTGGDVVLEQR